MKRLNFLFAAFLFFTTLSAQDIPILHLSGTPYEMGFQHGKAMKDKIALNIKRLIDDRISSQLEDLRVTPFIESMAEVLKYIPEDYMEEMMGLADGAEVPFENILVLNLIPEMFHCVGITVKGDATKEGQLYHVRVLDYAFGMGLQDSAVIMIVEPEGKIPFLNISFAGFIGSVTGMNAEKIAIGEIGGKGYGEYIGMPMAFLLRSILENAANLQEIKQILESTARTCEYYYVFSDGKTDDSIGVYATGKQIRFIEPGTQYAIVEEHDQKVIVSQIESSKYQTALYQDAEKKQLICHINTQPAHCLVLSHPKRYPYLINGLMQNYGKIGLEELQEVIKTPLGRQKNLHNAIFAPSTLDAWISHAGLNGEAACDQPYFHLNLGDLLR